MTLFSAFKRVASFGHDGEGLDISPTVGGTPIAEPTSTGRPRAGFSLYRLGQRRTTIAQAATPLRTPQHTCRRPAWARDRGRRGRFRVCRGTRKACSRWRVTGCLSLVTGRCQRTSEQIAGAASIPTLLTRCCPSTTTPCRRACQGSKLPVRERLGSLRQKRLMSFQSWCKDVRRRLSPNKPARDGFREEEIQLELLGRP